MKVEVHSSPVENRRAKLYSQAGQALFELALLTPLLLAALIGAIELGRYAYIGILIGSAARAGAAYGAENLANCVDATGIQTAADNDFQNNGQQVANLAVNSSVSCGCDSGGGIISEGCNGGSAGTCSSGHWVVMVSVTASGTFQPMFKYPGISNSISLSRTSTMRVGQ